MNNGFMHVHIRKLSCRVGLGISSGSGLRGIGRGRRVLGGTYSMGHGRWT